jgi:sortase (surface protein transpeptidase)
VVLTSIAAAVALMTASAASTDEAISVLPKTGPSHAAPQSISPTARSTPISLHIPSIALSVPLTTLGLRPDGTVEVPSDFQQAGWYRLGPAPGEAGSAVILGHVDSYAGPAVFFRLRSLQPGERIEVPREDGTVAEFAVTAVATYPKEDFPAEDVYGRHGPSSLQLVTCGGEFDPTSRSYSSNVVVYTSLVSVRPITTAEHPAS